MITPSFSLTATERVLPKLALDFTTATLDPRVTFTRTGNTATVVNSSGVIASVNADIPRFDYDPVTLACKGLLIEEGRANLLTYSSQLNQTSVWTPTRLTVSSDFAGITAPDGTQTADKLIASTDPTTSHLLTYNPIGTTGDRTFSVFFKAGEYSYVVLYEANIGKGRYFNLSNGTLGSVFVGAPNTSTIENYGNGWYRCSITVTVAGTWTGRIYVANADGGANFTGNGSDGIYAWGAQMEIGAFATSYIPTTTTALTRNADVASMTGTNFSDWYNASEGSLSANFTSGGDTLGTRVFDITDTGGNNRAAILGSTGGGSGPYFLVVSGGATQASTTAGTFTVNTTYTVVGGYKVNSFAASINGAAPSTDASGIVPNVPDKAYIGTDGTNYLNGWVKKLAYWPQRLINAEIQAFSK